MKVWLHGPRAGKDFIVGDVVFKDGVAEVHELSPYLQRYYNVKDHPPIEEEPVKYQTPPASLEDMSTTIEINHTNIESAVETLKENRGAIVEVVKEAQQTKEEVDHQKELSDLVQQKKAELENKPEKTLVEQCEELKNWGKQRKFIFEKTGVSVNRKKAGMKLLEELDNKQ